jgi:hypothetical protein
MTRSDGDETPHIDPSLDPIRAAIQMVADGSAVRVTVYTPAPTQLLPAARALARAAGVAVESGDELATGSDFVVEPAPSRIA